MFWPILLLMCGLVLVFIEFYLPGAILGTIGAILLVLAVVFFALQATALWPVLLFFLVTVGLVVLTIKFALWSIRAARPDRSIYSRHDQEGFQASAFESSLVGEQGIVDADLKPAGFILIEGKRYQALSKTGYLPRGVEVVVTGGEGAHLVVKRIKKEELV